MKNASLLYEALMKVYNFENQNCRGCKSDVSESLSPVA